MSDYIIAARAEAQNGAWLVTMFPQWQEDPTHFAARNLQTAKVIARKDAERQAWVGSPSKWVCRNVGIWELRMTEVTS
jgi:hypothetical protein